MLIKSPYGAGTMDTSKLTNFEETSSFYYWGGESHCSHEWKDNAPPAGMKACQKCGRIKAPK